LLDTQKFVIFKAWVCWATTFRSTLCLIIKLIHALTYFSNFSFCWCKHWRL